MDLEIVLACSVPFIICVTILVLAIRDKRDSNKKIK